MSENDATMDSCGCCEGIEALTPLALVNPAGLALLKYRVGTHGAFKQTMLVNLLNYPTLRKLTTRDDDDASIALFDLAAMMLDVLTFYQERITNEGYLRTATERLSIVELVRAIGYELNPGVAASTYLAFKLETAAGAPGEARIDRGIQVQSVPGQDEKPQIFETVEMIQARAEWNAMKPQQTVAFIPGLRDTEIYLAGVATNLEPGDVLLFVGDERRSDPTSERWDFRPIKTVTPNVAGQYTHVTWEEGLGWQRFATILPASENFTAYAFRSRASLFGYNAPDPRLMVGDLRTQFSIPANATEWPDLSISGIAESGESGVVYLDALYPQIVPDSWVVLSRHNPGRAVRNYEEAYEVDTADESSRKAFTLSQKVTRLQLRGENLIDKFDHQVRNIVVYAESEALPLAEKPVTDPLAGDKIILDNRVEPIDPGRLLMISGRRIRVMVASGTHTLTATDGTTATIRPDDSLIVMETPTVQSGGRLRWTLMTADEFVGTVTLRADRLIYAPADPEDAIVSEVVTIESMTDTADPSVITLVTAMTRSYDRTTVTLYGNVAPATHGKTQANEVLGSGNAAQSFQRFVLKQTPLTHVSAATPSGAESTLAVRVNDILWHEVPTLYLRGPRERVFVTHMDDEGNVTVQFGDGKTGARLPSGDENVRATYRYGIGQEGMLKAEQLSLLMTRPLGVRGVINPMAPTGAADPEASEAARENAPVTVLTLDRIVSLRDFEDFARAFAGVGKAQSTWLWDGRTRIVHLTIAADSGTDGDFRIDATSDLYINLRQSIDDTRDMVQPLQIDTYEPIFFRIEADVFVNSDYLPDKVEAAVKTALEAAFSYEQRTFGQAVHRSEVLAVMQAVEGVEYIDLNALYLSGASATNEPRLFAQRVRQEDGVIKLAQLLTLEDNGVDLEMRT